MSRTSERRADPTAQVLNAPAVRILEAAYHARGALTRDAAAAANGSGVKTADDYLRAFAKLGFLIRDEDAGRVTYRLGLPGLALVERRQV